jgi:hypothetical protein
MNPNPFTRFVKKLSILFSRERFASELDEEMAFHREQVEKELVAEGMAPEAARYAAMRQFGNETKLMEQSHEEVTFRVETVVQDLRFALRQWRRNPGFALTAVLILAPGMGVSVAIFGFVDAALLEPLPYANPDRLMSVNESNIEEPRWLSSAHSIRCGAGRGRARERQLLSDPRCASRARARLQSRRGPARRAKCCDPELWGMAPSLRRTSRCGGADGGPGP